MTRPACQVLGGVTDRTSSAFPKLAVLCDPDVRLQLHPDIFIGKKKTLGESPSVKKVNQEPCNLEIIYESIHLPQGLSLIHLQ